MILVDMNERKMHIEGNYDVIMSELTTLIAELAKDRGIEPKELLEDLKNAFNFQNLLDAGMTSDEAADILGLTGRISTEPIQE